jgi:hypothetical protein
VPSGRFVGQCALQSSNGVCGFGVEHGLRWSRT